MEHVDHYHTQNHLLLILNMIRAMNGINIMDLLKKEKSLNQQKDYHIYIILMKY